MMYIPLNFWFCRNPGLALPLIALQYHEIKINFEFRSLDELIVGPAGYLAGGELAASLFVDYIYMDTDERRRFAQVTHEYLIEQVQFSGVESLPANTNDGNTYKSKLQLNHPCKELVFMVSDAQNTTVPVSGVAPKRYFDYGTGAVGAGASAFRLSPGGGNNLNTVTGIYSQVNPITAALLQLNGHDRFSERDGNYFNFVQPYQHHENVPSTGINVYSFALKPEEHQPSGTCNMSRIDNATLKLTLKALPQGGNLYVFATNYNVLRVMSGMGGLAYSS